MYAYINILGPTNLALETCTRSTSRAWNYSAIRSTKAVRVHGEIDLLPHLTVSSEAFNSLNFRFALN